MDLRGLKEAITLISESPDYANYKRVTGLEIEYLNYSYRLNRAIYLIEWELKELKKIKESLED